MYSTALQLSVYPLLTLKLLMFLFSEKALSIPLNDIVSRLRFMFLILLMKIYFPTYTVLQFPVIKA